MAVDDREVAPIELASRKGRALLRLLLARRGAVVPAEVLVEALWGGRPPADPDANLATLVSRLRAVLGPDAIAGDGQGWRFVAGGRVEVDLDEAERLAGEPALAAAERGLDLLGRGPFLADEPDADWAPPTPARGRAPDRPGRRLAWDAALALADHARALDHPLAATTADPLDEAAWRALMTAQVAAGAPAAALAAYEQLRATLADELGTDPAPETQALHLAILRGTPATPPRAPGWPRAPRWPGRAAPRPTGAGRAAPRPTGFGGPNREGSPTAGRGRRVVHSPTASSGSRVVHSRTAGGGSAGLSTATPSDGEFVGRERELGDLAAAWAGAVGGGRGWC